MGTVSLTPVVRIEHEKCVNCYACIAECPVKYCMDGSGEKLTINSDLCIGCGNCINVCARRDHHARGLVDDTDAFFKDLKMGERIIAIAAPAVVSFFPEHYLNLNGWLKSIGVQAVFDVSFGAELTVVSYIDHIKTKSPCTVIAQPCPAIVNYIEIYRPELIPHLAPADSPMLHTIKMIREFFPQFRDTKVMVVSPCVAKKREFYELELGDYNVTMVSIKKYLEANKIELGTFPQAKYDGPEAERAVGFSSPGGLLDTAERFMSGISRQSKKIEGAHVYHFMDALAELLKTGTKVPLLVDCLNCEKGCNGGPGTGNSGKAQLILENPIRKRITETEENLNPNPRKAENTYKKYHKVLDSYWKEGLYNRSYRDLSKNNTLKEPNAAELAETYRILRKNGKDDICNCNACGYESCKAMAQAIFNKLNKPENCMHFILARLKDEMKSEELLNQKLVKHIHDIIVLVEGISKTISDLSSAIGAQTAAVEESSGRTEKMVTSFTATSELSRSKREDIHDLLENASQSQDSMRDTIQSVKDISQSVDGIASAIQIISTIAANTNLLSMNASIEAAHAGDAGKGFAVVADEIRRLSESTRENSRNISLTLKNIIDGITVTSQRSDETDNRIAGMTKEISGFAQTMSDLIGTFNELSHESNGIINALDTLKNQNSTVKTEYADIIAMTDKLRNSIHELAALAKTGRQ